MLDNADDRSWNHRARIRGTTSRSVRCGTTQPTERRWRPSRSCVVAIFGVEHLDASSGRDSRSVGVGDKSMPAWNARRSDLRPRRSTGLRSRRSRSPPHGGLDGITIQRAGVVRVLRLERERESALRGDGKGVHRRARGHDCMRSLRGPDPGRVHRDRRGLCCPVLESIAVGVKTAEMPARIDLSGSRRANTSPIRLLDLRDEGSLGTVLHRTKIASGRGKARARHCF